MAVNPFRRALLDTTGTTGTRRSDSTETTKVRSRQIYSPPKDSTTNNTKDYLSSLPPNTNTNPHGLQKLGTYRQQKYTHKGILEATSSIIKIDRNDVVLISFASHYSLKGLTALQARLEDYYSMRQVNITKDKQRYLGILMRKCLLSRKLIEKKPEKTPWTITNNGNFGNYYQGSTTIPVKQKYNPFFKSQNTKTVQWADLNKDNQSKTNTVAENPFKNSTSTGNSTNNSTNNSTGNSTNNSNNPFINNSTSNSYNPFVNNNANTTNNANNPFINNNVNNNVSSTNNVNNPFINNNAKSANNFNSVNSANSTNSTNSTNNPFVNNNSASNANKSNWLANLINTNSNTSNTNNTNSWWKSNNTTNNSTNNNPFTQNTNNSNSNSNSNSNNNNPFSHNNNNNNVSPFNNNNSNNNPFSNNNNNGSFFNNNNQNPSTSNNNNNNNFFTNNNNNNNNGNWWNSNNNNNNNNNSQSVNPFNQQSNNNNNNNNYNPFPQNNNKNNFFNKNYNRAYNYYYDPRTGQYLFFNRQLNQYQKQLAALDRFDNYVYLSVLHNKQARKSAEIPGWEDKDPRQRDELAQLDISMPVQPMKKKFQKDIDWEKVREQNVRMLQEDDIQYMNLNLKKPWEKEKEQRNEAETQFEKWKKRIDLKTVKKEQKKVVTHWRDQRSDEMHWRLVEQPKIKREQEKNNQWILDFQEKRIFHDMRKQSKNKYQQQTKSSLFYQDQSRSFDYIAQSKIYNDDHFDIMSFGPVQQRDECFQEIPQQTKRRPRPSKLFVMQKIQIDGEFKQIREVHFDIFDVPDTSQSNIKDMILREATRNSYIKPLSQIEITRFQRSQECIIVECVLKSRLINLPPGYIYQPLKIINPQSTSLCIANDYGSIVWQGTLDVTNIDFSNCIDIVENAVVLYERVEEPKIGKELNRQFYVTFFEKSMSKIKEMLKDGWTEEQIQNKFKGHLERMGITLLWIDFEEWNYSVNVVPRKKKK